MIATLHEPLDRRLLHGVSWNAYEHMLQKFEDEHRRVRVTYDRGELEIMTLSLEHESYGSFLGDMIRVLTLELDIPIRSGGSTTFRRILKKKGLEADECYWIQNENLMRGKKSFDIETDPPPDLAMEIEITESALPRMKIYAAFKVPEVWRFDGRRLRVFILGANGKYKESAKSRAFPHVPIREIERFLRASATTDETTLLRAFTTWVRATVVPKVEADQAKKNGKKSSK